MKGVRSLARLRDAVWRPSGGSMRALALAGVIVNAGITVTGAAVRVTGSGLGCPTWPKCTEASLVPAHTSHELNTAIEFGNRLLSFLVLAVGVAVYVAAVRLRPRRRDLVRLAAVQPLSVVAQAIMGGVTVLTKLHPAAVSAHFLLSVALLAAAVALWVRAGEGDDAPRAVVRGELVWVGRALVALVAVLLAVGTVVTGTGPHAGDAQARRWGFDLERVAQLHVDVVWATVGLTFALLLGLRLTAGEPGAASGMSRSAPRPVHGRAQRRAAELLAVELAQGAIGYVQYFTDAPAALVIAHVLGSTLVWIAALRVAFALRDRGPVPRVATAPLAEPVPQPR
jgi:heme a synthase